MAPPFDPIAPKLSPSKSEVADIELRIQPLRFWLVTFKKAGTDELFSAVVLPDGTIVEPGRREGSLSFFESVFHLPRLKQREKAPTVV
jgi:hypothetical protein